MTLTKQTEKCPHCKETIMVGATRCRHCHADLGGPESSASFLAKYNRFRTGFLCGVLFTTILFILGYYHFFSGK